MFGNFAVSASAAAGVLRSPAKPSTSPPSAAWMRATASSTETCCRPLTITRADKNIIFELAGRPPLEVLQELLPKLPESDQKLARARKLGADAVINYKTTPDWGKAAANLAGNGGVDHVVEVGGAGTFLQSVHACRCEAKIGLIGILSGREAESEIFPIVPKCATVSGIYVGSREMFEEMNRALEQTGTRPVIDKVFPFDSAREAYEYMASGSHFGKVVIRVGK